ncbi:MAG: hypothetical protein ACP5FM_09515 [Acidithiobacillus sp.]
MPKIRREGDLPGQMMTEINKIIEKVIKMAAEIRTIERAAEVLNQMVYG